MRVDKLVKGTLAMPEDDVQLPAKPQEQGSERLVEEAGEGEGEEEQQSEEMNKEAARLFNALQEGQGLGPDNPYPQEQENSDQAQPKGKKAETRRQQHEGNTDSNGAQPSSPGSRQGTPKPNGPSKPARFIEACPDGKFGKIDRQYKMSITAGIAPLQAAESQKKNSKAVDFHPVATFPMTDLLPLAQGCNNGLGELGVGMAFQRTEMCQTAFSHQTNVGPLCSALGVVMHPRIAIGCSNTLRSRESLRQCESN